MSKNIYRIKKKSDLDEIMKNNFYKPICVIFISKSNSLIYDDLCTTLLSVSKLNSYNMTILIDFDDFIDNIDYFSSIKNNVPYFMAFFKGKVISSLEYSDNFIPILVNQIEQIHNSYINKLRVYFNQENNENNINNINNNNTNEIINNTNENIDKNIDKSIDKNIDIYYRDNYPNSAEYKINLYPLFIELAFNLAKQGSIINFIIPDSFLLGMYFSKLRKLLVEKNTILKIDTFNHKVFDAIVGFSVILTFKKGASDSGHNINVNSYSDIEELNINKNQVISQDYYQNMEKNKFLLFANELEKKLFDKIHKNVNKIKDFATCRTGIRSKIGQKELISKNKNDDRFKRGIISGSQLKKFAVIYDGDWLNIDPSILNSGGFDYEVINNPKILIRQTGDSIISAIDSNCYYHLNNVHSLALNEKYKNINLEVLVVYLNSKLYNFIYTKLSNEKNRPLAQVRIDTIESLPIKLPNASEFELINNLYVKLIAELYDCADVTNKLNYLLYRIYELTPEEIDYIEKNY